MTNSEIKCRRFVRMIRVVDCVDVFQYNVSRYYFPPNLRYKQFFTHV